jgi:hypothetical protein
MEGRVKMYILYLHITAAAIVVLSSFLAIRTLTMVSHGLNSRQCM